MLAAMKLDKKIRIAFDEWNLRSWHHPNVHTVRQGTGKEEYITPRDKNDDNSMYTMADAVFTACFLSAMNRNCDIVGMANFAPILNTRGCIYSYPEGIVLRSTYHVFDLYVNYLGDTVVDLWTPDSVPGMHVTGKNGQETDVETLDLLATTWSDRAGTALAVVNKHPSDSAATVSYTHLIQRFRIIQIIQPFQLPADILFIFQEPFPVYIFRPHRMARASLLHEFRKYTRPVSCLPLRRHMRKNLMAD